MMEKENIYRHCLFSLFFRSFSIRYRDMSYSGHLRLGLCVVLSLICLSLSAQSTRTELEDRRKQLLADIERNNARLVTIKKDKEAKLSQYVTLQSQIRKRRQLVNTLQEELRYADAAILRVNDVMVSLQDDIIRLKTEYAQMLRIAYRHRLSGNFLAFLFSAQSFNDAFRRWQYLQQYNRYRKRQAQLIIETQERLESRARQLEEEKQEKEQLLLTAEQQQQLLSRELGVMDDLIASLKKNESKVAALLDQQQEDHQRLNDMIENIILEEMARKRREARQPAALQAESATASETITADNTSVPATTSLEINGDDFAKSKGRLPWPVQNGVITRRFGTQTHPTIKSVEITNNGIDISTDAQTDVLAIFAGEVVGAQYVPGYKNTLILQHGPYYTVYSNLDEAYVSRGQVVDRGQALGRMGDNNAELHFEVWREKQKLNPIHWIQKR